MIPVCLLGVMIYYPKRNHIGVSRLCNSTSTSTSAYLYLYPLQRSPILNGPNGAKSFPSAAEEGRGDALHGGDLDT